MPTQKEMPRYKCHKEVHALKLADVRVGVAGDAHLYPSDVRYKSFWVNSGWVAKHEPKAGGYYVVYKDGYSSWSPAEAFEEGYTLIDG